MDYVNKLLLGREESDMKTPQKPMSQSGGLRDRDTRRLWWDPFEVRDEAEPRRRS